MPGYGIRSALGLSRGGEGIFFFCDCHSFIINFYHHIVTYVCAIRIKINSQAALCLLYFLN